MSEITIETAKEKLDALKLKINETESIDGKISKLANSCYVFWHDLQIEDVQVLLNSGYSMSDLAGRVSKNDTLIRWDMYAVCDCGQQMNLKRIEECKPVFHCKHCDRRAIEHEKIMIAGEMKYNRM
jgi:hypothetical protein